MKKFLLILLCLPVTVFGTITVVSRGTGTDSTTASTTTTIQGSVMSGNMTAGNTGIIVMAMDNANSAGANLAATSYTDSAGNVWFVRLDSATAGTANNTQELAVLTSRLTANFTTSDSLAITLLVASVVEAWTITEASTDITGAVIAFEFANSGSSVNTTTPSFGTNFSPSTGDLAIGCGATEGVDTWVGDTVNTTGGSWVNKQSAGAGAGVTGMSVISQTKVVSVYGAQTFAPTLGTIGDTRIGFIVMTEADPKVRSIGGNTTSSSSLSIPVNFPMGTVAGSLGVLCLSADNAGGTSTNFPATLTDGGGNTWTRQFNGLFSAAAQLAVENGIYTAPLTNPVTLGQTIAGTFTVTVPAKNWVVWEFAPAGVGTVTFVTGNAGSGTTTTTPSITTSASVINGNYVIGMIAAEGNNTFTADTDTLNGVWKAPATIGSGVGLAGNSVISQWKKVTATGGQTYNSVITSADTVAGYIEINDSTPVAQSQNTFFTFFP